MTITSCVIGSTAKIAIYFRHLNRGSKGGKITIFFHQHGGRIQEAISIAINLQQSISADGSTQKTVAITLLFVFMFNINNYFCNLPVLLDFH